MSDAIGISFPGVDFPLAASYTLGHGISPSIATLEMVPQYGSNRVQQSGDLVLSLGEQSIVVRDCKVDSATTRYSTDGARTIVLRILDRRWKWKFGIIGGRYNVRLPDNSIDLAIEKTPQELAKLLLDEMGETGYSVGDLPNDPRPEIEWVADNPAQELEDLCSSLGCRVVLQTDNTVAIRVMGEGADLPDLPQISLGFGINPPDRPESMTFVSGPVRFQQALELEAVGEDTDGSIKLIDNLSYAPSGGWSNESPYSDAILASSTDAAARTAAQKTVFRWYRIKDSVSAPEYPDINKLEDILPVDDFLVTTHTMVGGKQVPGKAYVYGNLWERNPGQTGNTNDVECHVSFSLDRERGIVQFSDFVVKLDATTGQVSAAELKLVCSYNGRDSATKETVRWRKQLPLNNGTQGAGTQPVYRDDVTPTVKEIYSRGNIGTVTGTTNNIQSDVEPEAQYHLEAAANEYQDLDTDEREYPGIIDINPDGAIQQVGWTVKTGNGGGAFTQASRNSEYSLAVPTYKESKRIAAAQVALKLAKQQQAKSRKGGFGGGGP